MNKRKSISKKKRFNVFKRDSFTCQYCGQRPPDTILEVDHIMPVCEGGKDNEINLVTSCFDCNRGKGGTPLEVTPAVLAENLQERTEQVKAYNRLLSAIKRKENAVLGALEEIIQCNHYSFKFNASSRASIRNNFIPKFTPTELEGFMATASEKCSSGYNAFKYFCGICWKELKGRKSE